MIGLRLGLGLGSPRTVGGAAAPASTITALTVMQAGGLVTDGVDGADAADPNGFTSSHP